MRLLVACWAALLLAGGPGCGGSLTDGDSDADSDADGDGDVDADVDDDVDDDADVEAPRVGPPCLLLDPEDARAARSSGRDFFAPYLGEVLGHAGVPYVALDRAGLAEAVARCPVLLLPYDAPLDAAAAEAVSEAVRGGATLVAMGGGSGLETALGVAVEAPVDEGFLSLVDDAGFLEPPPMPLHGFAVAPAIPTSSVSVGELLDADGAATGRSALTVQALGEGEAWYLGVDLATTIVRIQQGRPIVADGEPAPDGTAPVDDGILKTDDGIALDYMADRGEVGGAPLFLEPVVDLWIDLLLRILLRGCERAGLRLPMLWYWPGELDAVGVLSHDTDGNDPALARDLLAELEALGVESTWCFIRYPETYPDALFSEVAAAGFEVSLHYDARTPDNPETTWAEENFLGQLAWLEAASGLEVTTNKNHYLRWEGWVDFYLWCEAAGIQADQSKGPSKSGNVGFLYGTSHPHFPVHDGAHENRLIDVLAVDLLAQDLVHTCPYDFGPALVDRAARHYGVAHFLFHPAHVHRDGVPESMADLVGYGRSQGLEWWTVARLNDWERARRRVEIDLVDEDRVAVRTPAPLEDATILLPLREGEPDLSIRVDGSAVSWTPFPLRGSPTARLTLDLPAGSTEIVLTTP